MVKKPDIQYIDNFYVHGSEARVLELKPRRRIIKTVLPLSVPDKTIKIGVDPIALGGIVVALTMLVLLVVGTVQYVRVCGQYQAMMDYVVKHVKNIDKAVISVHCHNDIGLAVANSLAAVTAGARQVEGTINGIGERAGNAAIEEVAMVEVFQKLLHLFFIFASGYIKSSSL